MFFQTANVLLGKLFVISSISRAQKLFCDLFGKNIVPQSRLKQIFFAAISDMYISENKTYLPMLFLHKYLLIDMHLIEQHQDNSYASSADSAL